MTVMEKRSLVWKKSFGLIVPEVVEEKALKET